MGKSYNVPRNVKGESRLLYIFTMRSFLTTAGFGIVGFFMYLLLAALGLKLPGLITMIVLALIGYGVGALTIPDSPLIGNLRKAGGEKVGDILLRTLTFGKRKKIYIYRLGGNKK